MIFKSDGNCLRYVKKIKRVWDKNASLLLNAHNVEMWKTRINEKNVEEFLREIFLLW